MEPDPDGTCDACSRWRHIWHWEVFDEITLKFCGDCCDAGRHAKFVRRYMEAREAVGAGAARKGMLIRRAAHEAGGAPE